MSLITELLANAGISIANPLIIAEEELELQKLFVADPASYRLVCEAVGVLTAKLVPHITGTSLGAKAARAFIADLQTGVIESAKANNVTL